MNVTVWPRSYECGVCRKVFMMGDKLAFEKANSCCSDFAREHFQAGLRLGLRLVGEVIDKADFHYDMSAERKKVKSIADKSEGYPLNWQPPKEGESLL